MTKDELQILLDAKGVPGISYSLDGLKNGECLCVLHDEQEWKVVYNSRGRITYTAICANEEDAYQVFLEVMKNDYGWGD